MDNLKIKADVGLSNYDAFDLPLAEFKVLLDALAAKVGGDATSARFFIELERDYEGYADIECYVYRYETDEEMKAREAEGAREYAEYEQRVKAEALRIERAEYERLKAKYG